MLRRSVSRQYYQMDELLELHAQLRLDIQQLSAPSRFPELSETDRSSIRRSDNTAVHPPSGFRTSGPVRLPLMRWQRPVRPDGVDAP
ncbi:MAG: hypothetical protein MK110_08850 [Fuerstiella sp.]|nr:hypothetical protein [Fuerstiella sp.]